MSGLSDPKLAPGGDGSLRSERYGDIYFQHRRARQETRTVFLSGCDLPRRWRQPGRHTVAETGFGTGLNFLETWRQEREATQRVLASAESTTH